MGFLLSVVIVMSVLTLATTFVASPLLGLLVTLGAALAAYPVEMAIIVLFLCGGALCALPIWAVVKLVERRRREIHSLPEDEVL